MSFDDALKQQVAKFRREFGGAAMGGPNAHLPPIKDICLVGGIPDPEDPSFRYDLRKAHRALELLVELNIPIHPLLDIYFENIQELYGGVDYLKSTRPADMAIMAFLYTPHSEDDARTCIDSCGFTKISPLHTVKGIWHRHSADRGVKVLYIDGDDDAVFGPKAFLERESPFVQKKVINSYMPKFLLTHRDYKIA